jgi:hypothetical protein
MLNKELQGINTGEGKSKYTINLISFRSISLQLIAFDVQIRFLKRIDSFVHGSPRLVLVLKLEVKFTKAKHSWFALFSISDQSFFPG